MDINTLRVFLTSCETLNFTETAKRVYISRQAVSQTIRKLEQELNTTLFLKNKNMLSLTPAGQKLKSEACRLLTEYDRFETSMADYLQNMDRTLEIWVGAGATEELPCDLFTNFSAVHPEILLSVKKGTNTGILEQVRNSDGKVGLIGTLESMLMDFNSLLVKRGEPYVLVNRRHPLAQKSFVTVEDLRDVPVVGHGEEYDFHRNYVSLCLKHGFSPRFSIITVDPEIAIQLVRENRSAAFALESCRLRINPEEIVMLPFVTVPQNEWGIYLVSSKTHPSSTAQQVFADYVRNAVPPSLKR